MSGNIMNLIRRVFDGPMQLQPRDLGSETIAQGVRLAIENSDSSSYFKCDLNEAKVWLPRDTLRTMIHCISVADDHLISLRVETAHIAWMTEQLVDAKASGRSLFIDVGAATGAATIPIAMKLGDTVSVVAFEPAAQARRLLESTLIKNGIQGVRCIRAAVSSAVGVVQFIEYDHDPSGGCPFLPEASTIAYNGVQTTNGASVEVDCVTLDAFFAAKAEFQGHLNSRVVVKIDVEGFEAHVLTGGTVFISEFRPYFSIDIHKKVDGDDSTEADCRAILGRFHYKFKNMGHVLLATP